MGTDEGKIVKEAQKILRGERKRCKRIKYWDGQAAERIVRVLAEEANV